jgi:tetratricopeptide (TPR) repeat protein
MSRAHTLALGLAVALGLGGAAAVLHARETHFALPVPPDRLLYLRSGKAADRLALSFDAVMSDVYWIRTIQHYGRDFKNRQRANRFELLYPLLDLTTTLDPRFLIAYRFGATFLAAQPPEGPGRADQAIELLEKGLRATPGRWQLAHDIGFVHYFHTGDFKQAGEWFERAASMTGSPSWLAPLAATTLASGGNRQGARQMLIGMSQSEEDYIRRVSNKALRQLTALDAIDTLTAKVEAFHTRQGRYPGSWGDMIRVGALPAVPVDEYGVPFAYDPVSHTVTIGPGSPLLPLLPTLVAK